MNDDGASILEDVYANMREQAAKEADEDQRPPEPVARVSFLDEPHFHTSFEDLLQKYHALFPDEPLTKALFESALVSIARSCGLPATRAPTNNPGYDAIINSTRFSLKTQSDLSIQRHEVSVSKFMQVIGVSADMPALRRHFLQHLRGYERIFMLRVFRELEHWRYELLEIPLALLALVSKARLRDPKDRSYPVILNRFVAFEMYFDRSAQKVSLKNLQRSHCPSYGEWRLPRSA